MRYISGKLRELKVGISSHSESKTSLIATGNVNVSGSVTATSFIGDGSALTNVTIPGISTSGTSEFTHLDLSGNLKVAGISTFNGAIDANGQIVGAATSNIIPFLYANYSDLPSPVTYHGAFAHVHATQKAYFAHGGAWYQLVNQESTGTVGTGTERYNIGPVDLTTLDVSGISTFAGNINANGNIVGDSSTNISGINSVTATSFFGDGSGLENTGATLSAASGTQRLVLTSLTSGTMTSAATDADLSFDAASNLLSAGKLLVSGISTFQDDINLGDNDKINLGDNDDFQIFHHNNGTGIIQNAGSGQLQIRSDEIRLLNQATDEDYAFFRDDGAVELYYNNTKRFETTGYGVTVLGTTQTQQLNVSGVSTFSDNLKLPDNKKIQLGDSGDLEIYHGGSHSYLTEFGSGGLYINGTQVTIGSTDNLKISVRANPDTHTALYYNNSERLETTGYGVTVLGTTQTQQLNVSGVSTFTKQLNVGTTVKLGPAGVITATTFKGDVDAVNIDVDGRADIDDLIVTGVSTFSGAIDSNVGANIDGGLVADTAKISDLTNTRVVYAGVDGELQDSSNLTFDGTTLNGTFSGDGTALLVAIPGISTSTTSEFTNLRVVGVLTAGSAILGSAKVSDLTDNRVVIAGTGGELEDSTNLTFDGSTLSIIGDATFTGNVTVGGTLTSEDKTNIDSIGIVTARTGVRINTGGLVVTAGVSTFSDAIDANNGANISGGVGLVAATAKVSDLTSGRVVVAGTAGELEDSGSFTFSGGTVTATAFAGDGSALTGITASGLGAIGGLTIKDEGVVVGTAGSVSTIDFRGGLVNVIATAGAAGVATATITSESNPTLAMLSVTGVSTFQSAVGISSDLTLSSTDTGSSAGPILNLYRNSATPADADYLGQIKFQGESDTGVQRNYAKITGKILDASNGTEDGIIEFAHIKAGSQNISARFRSDSLQLLNSTNFSVDGNSTFTGTAEFDGTTNLDGTVSSNNSAITISGSKTLQINNDAQRLRLKGTGTAGAVESMTLQLNTNAEGGSTQHALTANFNGGTIIYHLGSQKFTTTSTGVVVTGIATATDFDSTSDIRLKTNIQAIEDPLAKVVQIEGVSFNWKEDNRPALGVIADQVEKIIPELVHGDNPKTVNYNGLIGLLIEAVKEQQVQITELKSKLDSLS